MAERVSHRLAAAAPKANSSPTPTRVRDICWRLPHRSTTTPRSVGSVDDGLRPRHCAKTVPGLLETEVVKRR